MDGGFALVSQRERNLPRRRFATSDLGIAATPGLTALLLHCDGADNSTAFTDLAGHTVTTVGGAKVSAAEAVFGSGGLKCTAAGDYLSIPYSLDFDPEDGAYTWEGWINPASLSGDKALLCTGEASGSTTGYLIYVSGSSLRFLGARSSGTAGNIVTLNSGSVVVAAKKHWAVCQYADNTWALYYDGSRRATQAATAGVAVASGRPLLIGKQASTSRNWLGGQDEIRLWKGGALYSGLTYTVPTRPFT